MPIGRILHELSSVANISEFVKTQFSLQIGWEKSNLFLGILIVWRWNGDREKVHWRFSKTLHWTFFSGKEVIYLAENSSTFLRWTFFKRSRSPVDRKCFALIVKQSRRGNIWSLLGSLWSVHAYEFIIAINSSLLFIQPTVFISFFHLVKKIMEKIWDFEVNKQKEKLIYKTLLQTYFSHPRSRQRNLPRSIFLAASLVSAQTIRWIAIRQSCIRAESSAHANTSKVKSETKIAISNIKRKCFTVKYLATSLLFGDKTESELLLSINGRAFVFSHLKAALTFVHLETYKLFVNAISRLLISFKPLAWNQRWRSVDAVDNSDRFLSSSKQNLLIWLICFSVWSWLNR